MNGLPSRVWNDRARYFRLAGNVLSEFNFYPPCAWEDIGEYITVIKKNWIFHLVVSLSISLLFCLSIANAAEQGLIASWPMNEGQGQVVKDVSGNGNDGAIEGGVQWVEGIEGTALEFDGTSGWVNCGQDASLYTTKNQCTLMCWFKPTADIKGGGPRQNILYHAGAPMFGFNIFVNSPQLSDIWKREEPGTLVVWVGGPGDKDKFPQTPLTSKQAGWPADEWHHAAFVYDGSQCRLYVDGELEDSLDRQGEIGIVDGRVFAIGGAGGASHFYKGIVDEIEYYNRPLTAPEINGMVTAVEPVSKLASTWGQIRRGLPD